MKICLLSLRTLNQRLRKRWKTNIHNKINQRALLLQPLRHHNSLRHLPSGVSEWIYTRQIFCGTLPSSRNMMINNKPPIPSDRRPLKSKPLALMSSTWRTRLPQMACSHGCRADGLMTTSSTSSSSVRLRTSGVWNMDFWCGIMFVGGRRHFPSTVRPCRVCRSRSAHCRSTRSPTLMPIWASQCWRRFQPSRPMSTLMAGLGQPCSL